MVSLFQHLMSPVILCLDSVALLAGLWTADTGIKRLPGVVGSSSELHIPGGPVLCLSMRACVPCSVPN